MTKSLLEHVQAYRIPFSDHLGIEFTEATPERVRATLKVRPELCTIPNVVHGGALMAFADTMGAVATVLNLKDGYSTTTLESKTNFISGGPEGATLVGETTPVHRGRRTQVWQTRITREDGALVAQVIQTQMVLEPRPAAKTA